MDAGVAHMMPPPSPPAAAPRSLASTAPPDAISSLTEQAKAGRNLVLVYLALAMLIAAMWDALHIELKVYLNAAVWVSLFNNGTIGSDHPLEEQPGLPG